MISRQPGARKVDFDGRHFYGYFALPVALVGFAVGVASARRYLTAALSLAAAVGIYLRSVQIARSFGRG